MTNVNASGYFSAQQHSVNSRDINTEFVVYKSLKTEK